MLKRLRWKFIGTAMLAVCIVLTVLVSGINIVYRHVTIRGMDNLLSMIAENQGQVPQYAPERTPSPWNAPITPETPFETRFFVVWPDAASEASRTQMDFIASVTGEDAESFLALAMSSGDEKGFVEQYRFLREEEQGSTFYVFLDSTRQLRTFRDLLLVSALITLSAMCLTFLLVWIFSGRAIRPTVRNVESQKRFITDASHEIKTPLTVISSYADVMCMENAQNEWAQGIKKESLRLSRLVSDLVLLSRWDEEMPMREKRRFDLSRALWDTVTPYRNLAEARGKSFHSEIAEDLAMEGDESAIQTAVSTLLENAVQYSLPGSTIFFSARRSKRSIAIEVSNESLLPENLEPDRLFDRFYRADPSRSRDSGGTGVGLSLAKAIVEAHEGRIGVRCDGNDRITFHITFPAA